MQNVITRADHREWAKKHRKIGHAAIRNREAYEEAIAFNEEHGLDGRKKLTREEVVTRFLVRGYRSTARVTLAGQVEEAPRVDPDKEIVATLRSAIGALEYQIELLRERNGNTAVSVKQIMGAIDSLRRSHCDLRSVTRRPVAVEEDEFA